MVHEMKLQDNPFNWIKSGNKIFELRLYDEKRRGISVGDTIQFTNMVTSEQIVVKVLALHVFKDFEELYKNIPKSSMGYAEGEEALPQDMEKYYSIQEQQKYNVVAIEIKLI